MSTESAPQSSDTPAKPKRLMSLDALRGFDMFFIVGGAELIRGAIQGLDLWFLGWVLPQLHHPQWEGVTAYDFIFPLFLFMVGVSLSYSVGSAMGRGVEKRAIYRHAFIRMVILCVLGIVYKNRPLHFDWEQIRYVSVLGRIGVTGFFATLIVCNFNFRTQVAWMFGLLVAYWAALMFVPVPGYGPGVLTMEGSLTGYIDRMLVPGRLIKGIFDENGFTCHIPATALVLIGSLAGQILRRKDFKDLLKARVLALAGLGLLALGLLWGLHVPVMKALWTPSFILVTGGTSLLLLAVFHLIIDCWGFQKWAFFFVVIGLNSITIYLASGLIHFEYTADYLLNGFYQLTDDKELQGFVQAIGVIVLQWGGLYFLYRRKIFVKV